MPEMKYSIATCNKCFGSIYKAGNLTIGEKDGNITMHLTVSEIREDISANDFLDKIGEDILEFSMALDKRYGDRAKLTFGEGKE